MNKIIFPLMIISAASCYGILSTIIKVAMQRGFTATEAVSSQYIVGCFLALLLFLWKERNLPALSRDSIILLTLTGTFTATTGIVYGQSLNYLPASLAVVLLFQFTWIGVLLNCIIQKRLPSQMEFMSSITLLVGTVLAAGVLDADLSTIAWQGWLFGLLAAVSFACFIQVNARQTSQLSTITRTFLVSCVAVIIISLTLNPEIIWNGQLFEAGLWKFGILLGLFGTILPIFLFAIAVPKVGGGLASILSAAELPVAICASIIVLNEQMTLLQVVGIVIILFAMILPSRNAKISTNN